MQAQEENLEVIRSTALPWGSPVQNIFVDADNTKWVANTQTIKKVVGARSSDPITLKPGEMGLFQFPGGNANIRWQKAELTAAIGDIIDEDNVITAAFYDEINQDIWLGTSLTGAYRLRQENGQLSFQEQLSMDNTKLRSNYVHDIVQDGPGRIWIATNDGALVGKSGKWDLVEKGLIIEAIAVANGEVWLMGDGLIGKVDRRDRWALVDLPASSMEGAMHDIALDAKGRLWIASRVITSYDPATGDTQVFGGAEEYTSEFARHLTVDLDGAVWIGTEDKGLYVIQKGSSLVATVELESPVTCEGNGADGALRVKVTGGTPPYSFEWSEDAEGSNPQRLAPGTYRLTITDAKGNSRLSDISVPDRRVRLRAEAVTKVSGEGRSDGKAEARAQGGMPPYKYAWDNGETTAQAVKLDVGAHTVTVTDRLGCERTAVVDIGRTFEALGAAIEQVKPIRCQGNKSAVLKVTAQGGAKPYTYRWSVAESPTPQLTGLLAGTYTVTVIDANGTVASATYTVEEPPAFEVNAKITQPATANNEDGIAEAAAQGGTPPYTYDWSSGSSRATAEGLPAGAHTVTVTDANGCAAVAQADMTEDILPLALELEQEATIACQGAAAAAIRAEVSGGKGPFEYQWSGGKAGPKVTGLPAGNYTVTVSDAQGSTVEASITIEEPAALTARATQVAPANTGSADGQAQVAAKGGVSPYTYLWTNGATTAEIKNLQAGTYEVTVTDKNGCKASAKVDVTEDIAPLEVALEVEQAVSCPEAADGAVAAALTGGKGPFTYSWSNGAEGAARLGNVPGGSYTVTVTDVAGSTASGTAVLPEPEALKVNVSVEAQVSPGQADGEAVVSASGGNGNYQYAWSSGEAGPRAEQLPAGMQTVTVTDAKGCQSTVAVEMVEEILPLEARLTAMAAVSCAGGADGILAAEVKGGKAPFSYAWSNGQAEAQAEGLEAGRYTLTVTDAQGTTAEASLALAPPEALQASSTAVRPASTNASDGVAKATASGGTPPYQYNWSTGASAEVAESLPPGSHTLTVTDAKGCTATASVEISENILPLQVALTETAAISCYGAPEGAVAAEVTGGKGPFAYAWSSGQERAKAADLSAGTYTLTVTDAEGTEATASFTLTSPDALVAATQAVQPASTNAADGKAKATAQGGTPPYRFDWSVGTQGDIASDLPPGTHSVTVTDANGCTATASVDISENILPLQVELTQAAAISCYGAAEGALAAEVSGGKSPFAYAWSGGQEGAKSANLPAGTYTLTVTDAEGTEATASFTLASPDALVAATQAVQPASTNATDGKAKATAQGGTPPYRFDWSVGTEGDTASDLPPGAHSVTVTDAKGCTATASVEISENILPLELSIETAAPIACQGATGALNAVVSGGKGPFTYTWSNGASEPQASGLAAGAYELTITDAQGTTAQAEATLTAPAALTAQAIAEQPASTNNADGIARVSGSGGTPTYGYAWSSGASTAEAANLAPGDYTVTVTDANGCTAEAKVSITENILPLQVQLEATQQISCSDAADGAAKAVIAGGKPPYTLAWNDETLSGEQVGGLAPGAYALTVTDVAGNSQSGSLELAAPEPLQVGMERVEPAFSDTSEDGKAEVGASGGTPPYAIEWDNGSTGTAVDNLGLGQHSVTVADANGCSQTVSFEITERVLKELTRAVSSGQTIQMQKLQFEADSSRIQQEVKPLLNEIYIFLKDNPSIVVEIGGHTNNLPPDEYCDQLSTARARAVAEFLVGKGIPSDRVYYKGYGKRKPLFSNRTEDGRRRNQRVEIKILRL